MDKELLRAACLRNRVLGIGPFSRMRIQAKVQLFIHPNGRDGFQVNGVDHRGIWHLQFIQFQTSSSRVELSKAQNHADAILCLLHLSRQHQFLQLLRQCQLQHRHQALLVAQVAHWQLALECAHLVHPSNHVLRCVPSGAAWKKLFKRFDPVAVV